MKALVYSGPRDVAVCEVPDARIERPADVLVRITTNNICGSDLHMYEGRTDLEKGTIIGHENLGAREKGWTKVVLKPGRSTTGHKHSQHGAHHH
jgi:threonine dehydrogenase-like Zn-dependent dehydrogenase